MSKWYYKYTPEGDTIYRVYGTFDSESDANNNKSLVQAEFPNGVFEDPFEESDNYRDSLPVPLRYVGRQSGEVEIWSDGTEKSIN